MNLEVLLLALGAYLIGSFPSAWVVVKRTRGIDLRRAGTGNIGAMNSFDVTRSRATFALVFFLDVVKGFLPVLVAWWLFGKAGWAGATALTAVVAGHNYPIFLRFHGGRGLATAVGGCILVEPLFILVWAALWVLGMGIRRQVHFGNVVATLLSPLVLWFVLPSLHATSFQFHSFLSHWLTGVVLCALILARHLETLRESLSGKPRPS